MTDLFFTINSHDFKNLVRTGSDNYQTTRKTVYGAKYTDLDGVDHYIVQRYRDTLKINFRALDPLTVSSLMSEIQSQPMSIKFHSFQTGTDLTETMVVSETTLSDAIERSDGHWVGQFSITFTQV